MSVAHPVASQQLPGGRAGCSRQFRPLLASEEPGAARGAGPLISPVTLRVAGASDVGALLELINTSAALGLMLRRSEASLRAGLADFVVAVQRTAEREAIVGCGALAHLGPGLGEVRSLAVRAEAVGRGVGRRIVGRLLRDAPGRGHVEVLALTRRPAFFEALGFVATRRERFPEKLRADCGSCPRNLGCDEVALVWSAWGRSCALVL